MPSVTPSTPKTAFGLPLWWLVLAGAAVLRGADALRRPLQVDEAYSLHLAALPLAQGLRAVATLDVHPPLFLIVTHVLSGWNVPDWGFRLGAAALGVVSVAAFYAIVRSWHSESAALVAAALAAFMPSLIFYDTMIRMYALFDALALGGFLVLSILYTRDDLGPGARRLLWCGWTLASAASIATLYLGFAVLAAQLLYAAVLRRDGLCKTAAGAAVAFAIWAPQLPTFLAQLPRGGLAFPFYAHHELAAILALPGQATLAPQTAASGGIETAATIAGLAWIAVALGWGLRDQGRSLGLWLAVPGALTLAVSLAGHKLLYTDRYYLLCAYALCCLSALAIARVFARQQRAAVLAGATLGAVVLAAGCAYAVDPQLYTADWPAIGAVLQVNLRAGDLVIFEQGSGFFPLERGLWLDHHPLVLVFHRDDVTQAASLARPFKRVFLVLFQAGPVDPGLALLNGFRNARRLVYVWEFVRRLPAESASVLVFVRKPGRQ